MKTLIAIIALSLPANAQGIDMLPFYETSPKVERVSHPVSKQKPKAKRKQKRQGHSFRPAPPAAPPPIASDAVTHCFAPITVVGSQWVGESGAYDSAVKAAKELVRWRIGEMAMDPDNWKDIARRCSTSSVGEVVGQTFHRCEIRFTPCRPGMTEGAQ